MNDCAVALSLKGFVNQINFPAFPRDERLMIFSLQIED